MNRFVNGLCLIALPAVAWVAASASGARTADEAQSSVNLRELLLSDDAEQVARARKEVKRLRSEQVAQLSEIVGDIKLQRQGRAVSEAIAILGEIRSEEAIGVLVENIAYPYLIDGQDTMLQGLHAIGRPPDFPAVKALINIGPAAIVPVAKKLATCVDSPTNSFEYDACELVLYCLGDDSDKSVIRQCMDIAHKNAINDGHRERLAFSRLLLGLPPPPQIPKTRNAEPGVGADSR